MKKKIITQLAIIVGSLFAVSILVAKLYDIGVHRPSPVFQLISPSTIQWFNSFNRMESEDLFKAENMGPFHWSNKEDIGQKRTAGKWGREEDANIVVYYHKDKEAQGQVRARRVAEYAESIIAEVPEFMGIYRFPTDLNGRKLPIYLPDTDEKYLALLRKMNGEEPAGTAKYGCSVVVLGPLGCQNKGIVLHPLAFEKCDQDGVQQFVRVLRREIAYYTYLASLDYNHETYRYAWFICGLAERFAMGEKFLPRFSEKDLAIIEQECALNNEFPTRNKMHKRAGTSFFEFYESHYGRLAMTDLITRTFSTPVDSAFMQKGQDADSLKSQWVLWLYADYGVQ